MILYTNGCSWTATGGLDHLFTDENGFIDQDKRLSIAWPHHLGKLLNAEKVYNLATGCGSNQRIVRKTYNWLRSLDTDELKKVVAVIQITEWSRFEMYYPVAEENRWKEYPGDWVNVKQGVISPDIYEKNLFSYGEKFYDIYDISQEKLLSSYPIEDFYRTISYLYAMKGLFDSYNIKDFYIWHQGNNWHEWPKEHLDVLYRNFKVLDKHYDYNEWCFSGDNWEYERVSIDDKHPNVNGNIEIASILYDRMLRMGFESKE